jgi:signal transduction histidine kinase
VTALVSGVTDGRRAEAALAMRERYGSMRAFDLERSRKDIFVSTLAHELRQPLSAMVAAVDVMRLAPASAAADRAAAAIGRQIGQMRRLIDDLLDAARWTRGTVTLRTERLDLRRCRRCRQDVAAMAAAHASTFCRARRGTARTDAIRNGSTRCCRICSPMP